MPQNVTYVSSSTNQGSYDSSSGNWTVGNVADGAGAKLTITVTVNTGTGALLIGDFAAMAYADKPDSNLNNNDATASVKVNGADLGITNGEDDTTPSVGDTVTFTVTLTNNGPLDDTGIIVTDIVPAGLTYSSSVADQGTYDATTGIWTVGSVANTGTATLTLKVTRRAGMATQKITSTAKITHSDQPDGEHLRQLFVNTVQCVAIIIVSKPVSQKPIAKLFRHGFAVYLFFITIKVRKLKSAV